jgi:hypothetical protein
VRPTLSASTYSITCGFYGDILGGDLGVNAFVSKQYILPPHRGLKIRLTYLFLDSWDDAESGVIEVDGV